VTCCWFLNPPVDYDASAPTKLFVLESRMQNLCYVVVRELAAFTTLCF